LVALLPALLCASWPAPCAGSPGSDLSFSPCPHATSFTCTTVTVPLDRGGGAAGVIPLSVERLQAGPAPSSSAVVGLAGGPGQAANPLASFIAKAIAPALHGRDLIVFDQRGTGRSDPLNCPALGDSSAFEGAGLTIGHLAEQCALQLGPARGAFTSEESAQDIEAIRQELGYEKLALYGTSYGTKVALEYAERYPEHVEALVLDSVVLPEGPEPFELSTFQALGPVLGELCSEGACAHISTNPLGDIARLASALRRHTLSGSVYDGSGHRHSATLGEPDLLGIMEAGDLNPALRALLPAAVQSALHHEPDPLLRLKLLAEGLVPNLPAPPRGSQTEQEAREEEDDALFLATSCEEKPFPWQRAAPPATRNAEALAALHALPSSAFYPFDAATAWANSLVPACVDWPDASPAPPATSPLPDVPTLILSGAQDLRTPTANARAVAARIPDAQLLLVPYTGHSVLGSDFTACAEEAVSAFFASGVGGAIQPCKPTPDIFSPTPITPTRLSSVQPVPGLRGNPGRTLTAVLDTLVDLDRQVIGATLQVEQELPSGSSFGGLHGGYAKLSASAVRLANLTFVPGVAISGSLPASKGKLQSITVHVSGAAAARGTVTLATGGRASGSLGGRRFDVSIAHAQLSRVDSALAAAWRGDGAPLPIHFPLPALARLR
jgi:pimeloyl-ACP methyl ester carboxylesterase